MEAGDVKAVVGLADGCELLGALTRFPDAGLARGVVDGSVHGDAMGCAADMTASSGEQWEGMQAACEGFDVGEDDEAAVYDRCGEPGRFCTHGREAVWQFSPTRVRLSMCAWGPMAHRRFSAQR